MAVKQRGDARGTDFNADREVPRTHSTSPRLFTFRLINAVPIRRGRIMAEGLDAFGVHMIKRADAEAFSSLAARFDCVQCLRPILLAVIPQHLGCELVQL